MEHNKNLLDNYNNINDIDNDSFKDKINKKHIKLASSGLIWIFMFVFSFGALFVIFKSNENNYDDAKNIVLDANSNIIAEDNTQIVNSNIKDLLESSANENKQEKPEMKLIDIDEGNNQISSNEMIIDKLAEKSTEKVYQNKNDTAITAILKNDSTETVNKTEQSLPNDNNNLAVNNKVQEKPTKIEPTKNQKNVQASTGYVVNIYSTNTKNGLNDKLKQIKVSSKDALKNANFYVSQANVGNKVMFRVSVREGNSGYFKNKEEASSFCNKLKAKNVNCFVASVETTKLTAHIIK